MNKTISFSKQIEAYEIQAELFIATVLTDLGYRSTSLVAFDSLISADRIKKEIRYEADGVLLVQIKWHIEGDALEIEYTEIDKKASAYICMIANNKKGRK